MKKVFKLKNCFDDKIFLTLEMSKIEYILREVISGDEVFIVVYKNGNVETYDSDMHNRIQSYYEELEMIYPKHIDLNSFTIEPNTVDNFLKEE